MGLIWDLPPRPTKNGNIFISAPFPKNRYLQQNLFNLWEYCKEEIRDDGFSITKDKFTNRWTVYYFWTPAEASAEASTEASADDWKQKHKELLEKYSNRIQDMNEQF